MAAAVEVVVVVSLPPLAPSAEMSHPPAGAGAAAAAAALAAAAGEVVVNLPHLRRSADADHPPAGAAAAAAAPAAAVDEVGVNHPRVRGAKEEVLDQDPLVSRDQDLGVRRSPLLPCPGKGRQAGATVGVMADGTRNGGG